MMSVHGKQNIEANKQDKSPIFWHAQIESTVYDIDFELKTSSFQVVFLLSIYLLQFPCCSTRALQRPEPINPILSPVT